MVRLWPVVAERDLDNLKCTSASCMPCGLLRAPAPPPAPHADKVLWLCSACRTGRRDEAVGFFRRAALADPADAAPLSMLGEACRRLIVSIPQLCGQSAIRALNLACKWTQRKGGRCGVLQWCAWPLQVASLKGELQLAERMYQRATEVTPVDARARYNLGTCLGAQKRWSEAAEQLQQAVAIRSVRARAKPSKSKRSGSEFCQRGRPSSSQRGVLPRAFNGILWLHGGTSPQATRRGRMVQPRHRDGQRGQFGCSEGHV